MGDYYVPTEQTRYIHAQGTIWKELSVVHRTNIGDRSIAIPLVYRVLTGAYEWDWDTVSAIDLKKSLYFIPRDDDLAKIVEANLRDE